MELPADEAEVEGHVIKRFGSAEQAIEQPADDDDAAPDDSESYTSYTRKF